MKHYKVLLGAPIFVAFLVVVFLKDGEKSYLSSTTIYTGFASGYNITSGDRVDFFIIKTKFDNLFESFKSRTNREEIALRTLAYYLSKEQIDEKEMLFENQVIFNEIFTDEIKSEVQVLNKEQETYELLHEYYNQDYENVVYYILNSKYSPLINLIGLEKLTTIEAVQESTSDRIKVTYETTDPGVTFNSLLIAVNVIMADVNSIKSSESENVVDYFLTQSREALKKLDLAEGKLSELLTRHNIINYYEQTKWIASRKEDFEVAFQEEKLYFVAAQASEIKTANQLEQTKGVSLKTDKILSLRKDIRDLNSRISSLEINQQLNLKEVKDSSSVPVLNKTTLEVLENDLLTKSAELENEVKQFYNMKNSLEGVNTVEITSAWLEAVLEVEKYTARISLYNLFKIEFEETYSLFSKLGSQIKKMERKIGVLEEDYLDLLISLNDAKLMKQNLETAKLRVVDPPFFPLNPNNSKKKIFVIVGFLAGFILSLGTLLLLEHFDNSIKTPDRLREYSGLYLAAGFPFLQRKEISMYRTLYVRLISQLASHVSSRFYKKGSEQKPFLIIVSSTRSSEGKTMISQLLARELRIKGEKVLCINTSSKTDYKFLLNHTDSDNKQYSPPKDLIEVDLNSESIFKGCEIKNFKYLILEIPSLIGSDIPIKILKKADLSLVVVKSTRNWNKADKMAIDSYEKIINHEPSVVINGTETDCLESIIGEIPKKRSKLRRYVKRVFKQNLKKNRF